MASNGSKDVNVIVPKNVAQLQRIKLEKLMKNPNKEVVIAEMSEERTPRAPLEFIRNVWGSSAGAGSGDFHVYRGVRRREYARQKYLNEKTSREEADEEYRKKVEENKKAAEERTAKKRAKRLKKRKNKKMKIQKKKEDSEDEDDDESEENNSETDERLTGSEQCPPENEQHQSEKDVMSDEKKREQTLNNGELCNVNSDDSNADKKSQKSDLDVS